MTERRKIGILQLPLDNVYKKLNTSAFFYIYLLKTLGHKTTFLKLSSSPASRVLC